jgi:alkanesulfonate monooxygenase SsuD/methylene tetrahydromethanopterin reductase-like flavin-dependent oxidoreductase (luciferase family)
VLALWQGDAEHAGTHWHYPLTTSVPKPLQKPHPPLWVAARDPATFAWAMACGANIMATPLSRPHAEVGILGRRFAETLAQFPDINRPRFLMLRRACVYAREEDRQLPVQASVQYGLRFDTLFRNSGHVRNGFPDASDLTQLPNQADYRPEAVLDSMVFGTPRQVVSKLREYEAAGVDQFCYGASFGLPHDVARRSLALFIAEVMPHFAEAAPPNEA